MQVVVVEALSPSTKLKVPVPAADDRGVWREKERRTEVGCAGTECVRLSHVVWQLERSERLRHLYYVYGIGDFVTESKLAARVVQGWHRLRGHGHGARMVVFTSDEAVSEVGELTAVLNAIQSAINNRGDG